MLFFILHVKILRGKKEEEIMDKKSWQETVDIILKTFIIQISLKLKNDWYYY